MHEEELLNKIIFLGVEKTKACLDLYGSEVGTHTHLIAYSYLHNMDQIEMADLIHYGYLEVKDADKLTYQSGPKKQDPNANPLILKYAEAYTEDFGLVTVDENLFYEVAHAQSQYINEYLKTLQALK